MRSEIHIQKTKCSWMLRKKRTDVLKCPKWLNRCVSEKGQKMRRTDGGTLRTYGSRNEWLHKKQKGQCRGACTIGTWQNKCDRRKIGSYITVLEEDALEQAKEVQERIDKGEAKSPLAGIPMALKDNICTKNVKTTCASKMLEVSYLPMMRRCRKNFTMKVRCFWESLIWMSLPWGRPLKILI